MEGDSKISDIVQLISDIKHKKIYSSHKVALNTESLLERLISEGNWKNAGELMQQIKQKIKLVSDSLPLEGRATNIMRHILKIIREESEILSKKTAKGHQLVNLSELDKSSDLPGNLKIRLLDNLTEYKFELESSAENIATQALEHIHTDEIILTVGKSNTVEKFLKFAAEKRSFQVIVVEAAPLYCGHKMAASLAESNIQTTLIPDAAVFAMMSRVNKVIIGTHTVMADGGLRAACGMHAIALAAKHYSVPVMVLAHLYKLTPAYVCSHERDTFNICASPANVIPYSLGPLLNEIDVYNPLFDYVPPELVTLFVSHQGGNAPSYVYRLLSELYHPDDYDF